ncbi:MAG: hypothetical protein JJU02_02535 [Cryomorphaceae bacterium]|nr:hypothetical protein [Cryomorphaceae bacterium]
MNYRERVEELKQRIENITNKLQTKFYYTEPEVLHQPDKDGYSTIEWLEYANLKGYHYFETLQKTPGNTEKPDLNASHYIRFFARKILKKEVDNHAQIPPAFVPVSKRPNNEKVRLSEKKVFSDLLALLEMWKKMLEAAESENLKKVKVKTGFWNLFSLDALELATVSLAIIERRIDLASVGNKIHQ